MRADHYDSFAQSYSRDNESGLFNAHYERPAMLALGFVREVRHQTSLSFGTSGISPISVFASLGATPRWGRDTPVVGQRTAHAR